MFACQHLWLTTPLADNMEQKEVTKSARHNRMSMVTTSNDKYSYGKKVEKVNNIRDKFN